MKKILSYITLSIVLVTALFTDNVQAEETTKSDSGYEYVTFGSYPQRQVISRAYIDEVEATLYDSVRMGHDYIVNKNLYKQLVNTTSWDKDNNTVIDGQKYKRIKFQNVYGNKRKIYGGINTSFIWNGEKHFLPSGEGDFYYSRIDKNQYYYFKYEPVKWRIIDKQTDGVLLMSDLVIDSKKSVSSDNALVKKLFDKSQLALVESIYSDKTSVMTKNLCFLSTTYSKAMGVTTEDIVNVFSKSRRGFSQYVLVKNGRAIYEGAIKSVNSNVNPGIVPVIKVTTLNSKYIKKSKKSNYKFTRSSSAGHPYKTTIRWSKDCKSARITFICRKCSDKHTVNAKVLKNSSDELGIYYTAIAYYKGVVAKKIKTKN